MNLDPGHLTDAAARNLVIKALRTARKAVARSTTEGETLDREFDRLIKRKTRINSNSLQTVYKLYDAYLSQVEAIQIPLSNAGEITSQF
jgi:hypothetical protein